MFVYGSSNYSKYIDSYNFFFRFQFWSLKLHTMSFNLKTYSRCSLFIATVFLVVGSSASSTIGGESSIPVWRKSWLVRAEKQFEALLDCVTLAEDISDMEKGENLPFSKNQKRTNSAQDCLQKVFVLDFRRLVKLAYDVEEDNEKLINKTHGLEEQVELLKSDINLLQGDNVELRENLTATKSQEIFLQNEAIELRKNLSSMKSQELAFENEVAELRKNLTVIQIKESSLHHENIELRKNLTWTKSQEIQFQIATVELQKNWIATKSQSNHLENEIIGLRKNLSSMKSQELAFQNEVAELRKNLTMIQIKEISLHHENIELRKNLTWTTSQEIQFQIATVELQKNLTETKSQGNHLENEVIGLRKNLTAAKNQHILLQIKTDEMRKQIIEMRARLPNNTWDPDMFLAIHKENETALHFYVELGARVNARDIEGKTALQRASRGISSEFSLNAVKYLINKGASEYKAYGNGFLGSLFRRLNSSQFDDISNFLISKQLTHLFNYPRNWGQTAFLTAVARIEISTATLPLLHKERVDFNAVYEEESGRYLNLKLNDSVLGSAVRWRRTLNMISDLVNFGANPRHLNEEGESLLHIAADENTWDVVKYFIDLGLDVNLRDGRGWSPLMDAVKGVRPVLEKVRVLLANGADCLTTMKYNRETMNWLTQDVHVSEKNELLRLLRECD